MSERILRKIDQLTAADPEDRPAASDPWREFRAIERIDLDLEFHFHHSLGKVSRFFLELEHQRLMATRCPHCGTVWMPPRSVCADDMTITEWLELPGLGALHAVVPFGTTGLRDAGTTMRALGYVRLQGADTLLLQQIRNVEHAETLVPGLAVKAVWSEQPVAHPMNTFWFEPA